MALHTTQQIKTVGLCASPNFGFPDFKLCESQVSFSGHLRWYSLVFCQPMIDSDSGGSSLWYEVDSEMKDIYSVNVVDPIRPHPL